MTLTRRLALRISGFVACHASSGCKEWAEASTREVTFVRGDWAALGWALSSARVLLDYREAPLKSLADVPSAAYRFVERARSGYNFMWFMLLQGPVYMVNLLRPTHWHERAGCALAFGGSLVGWILLLIERHRLKAPYKDEIYDDAAACAVFYKGELERYRFTLTIAVCCFACFCAGIQVDTWRLFRHYGAWHLTWSLTNVLLVLAFWYAQRTNQRRLEGLNALLAERS